MNPRILSILCLFFLVCACNDEKSDEPSCLTPGFAQQFAPRSFKMGFSTWPYGGGLSEVESTYAFITNHSDIYSEQIDGQIPWNAWINDTPLPSAFTDGIQYKVSKKIPARPLLLSVSLLGTMRNELSADFDGSIPAYESFNDAAIRDAYLKHVKYLVDQFSPDYLVFAMEVNELHVNAPEKWEGYKLMASYLRTQLKSSYPDLKIAESLTLHSWFEAHLLGHTDHVEELKNYAMHSDFVPISFYAFIKGLQTTAEFQQAFDFLHTQTTKPLAIVETNHIAENLSIESFDLFLPSDECQQNAYLETLLKNAQTNDYEFVIWWAHRDYDSLWEIFPADVKDIGKLWRDTGLLNEDGGERIAFKTWKVVFQK